MIDVENIKTLAHNREMFYSRLRQRQREWQSVFDGTNDLGVRPPLRPLHLQRAKLAIHTLVSHVITDRPTAIRIPRNETQREQEAADMVEKWATGYLRRIGESHMLRGFVMLLAVRGECWWRTAYDDDVAQQLEAEPQRKRGEKEEDYTNRLALWRASVSDSVPIQLTYLDPMAVYAHPSERNGVPRDVVVRYKRTVWDVMASWPDWRPEDKGEEAEVEWLEYWSPEYRCFLADGKPVLDDAVQPNILGFVPFVHATSGRGLFTAEGRPEDWIRPAFDADIEVFLAQDRAYSQLDSMRALWAFTRVLTDLPEAEALAVSQQDWTAGGVVMLPEGALKDGRVQLHTGTAIPPGLLDTARAIDYRLEQSSPGVVRGEGLPGESGYRAAIRVGQARLGYGGEFISTEVSLSRAMAQVLRIEDTIYRKPLSISGTTVQGRRNIITLKPAHINGYYDIQVNIEASDPESTDRKQALGNMLWGSGLLSKLRALEDYLGISDATSELAQRNAEDIIDRNPVLKESIAKRVLQKKGLEADLEEAEKREVEAGRTRGPAAPGSMDELEQVVRSQRRMGTPGGMRPLESPPERI